ncbi:MAG: hypothetical protein AB4290_13750 [Spirulina sp.]
MFNQLALLPDALSEIFATASENGILTLCDRYGLMAATLTEDLNEEDRRAIDRLLRAIKRGRIQLATA